MAGSLPLIRGSVNQTGAQALYPITRRVEFSTDVALGLNSTEQRFKRRPPLTRFVLPYSRINLADMTAMRAFHAAQRGTFDATWSFTLGSTTYSHMTFEDDSFEAREEDQTRTMYSFTLRAKQTQNAGQIAGSIGGSFPTLANGAPMQLPYTQVRRYSVLLNDTAIGLRYSWTWVGGGLNGFPSTALWGWTLEYPMVTDADLATLETFFRNQAGRFARFTFTDPDDASVHTKCRFDDDVFEVRHNAPNQNSVTLRIQETN